MQRWLVVTTLMAGAMPRSLSGQDVTVEHAAVGCVVAERFPRFEARINPADGVGRALVHFRTDPAQPWYAVAMKREPDTFSAVLPKPKKSLKSFQYYIDATDRAFATSRTPDHTAQVVNGAAACQGKMMAGALGSVATILLQVPAGAALVPAGFGSAGVVAAAGAASAAGAGAAGASGGGGISTTAVVAGGAVVAGAAVVAVSKLGGDDGGSGGRAFGPFFFEGHVYRNPSTPCNSGTGCFSTSAPGAAAGPHASSCGPTLAGVTVRSSLSTATATTDAQGYFYLDTGILESESMCSNPGSTTHVLTASAQGCQTATASIPSGCHGGQATSCLTHIPLRCP